MKQQLDLFPVPSPSKDEETTAAIAKMRLDRMAREATKPGRRRFYGGSRTAHCPSCGTCFTI